MDTSQPRSLPVRLDAKLCDQRVAVRELVRLEFGIDDFSIHAYIEDATSAPNQSWLDAECTFELGGQTSRRWEVVSGAAVGDANIHPSDLPKVGSHDDAFVMKNIRLNRSRTTASAILRGAHSGAQSAATQQRPR
jgi:hypothetical protein